MFKSIRNKIILSYIVLIIIAVVVTSLFFQWTLKTILEQELIKQLSNLCVTYSEIIESRLGTGSFDEVSRKIVEEFVSDKQNNLRIFDLDGRLIAGSQSNTGHLSFERMDRVKKGNVVHWYENIHGYRIVHVSAPIWSMGKRRGAVLGITDLAASMDQIDYTYVRLSHQLLVAVIISVLLTVLISLILASNITRPIFRIRELAEKIARGDFSIRVEKYGDDETGSLAEVINYMADQIEMNIENILNEKNKMDALLSAMPEGVVALNEDGQILFLNRSARNYVGEAVGGGDGDYAEYAGKHLSDVWKQEKIEQFLQDGRGRDGIFSREIVLDNAIIKIYMFPFGHRERGAWGSMLIIRDVTDIRRLEEARSTFFGAISHELRTPLTVIKGFVNTINDDETVAGNEEVSNALRIINEETDRLTRLVNEILDLSRLQSKKLSLERETVDVDLLAEETVQQMSNNAQRMNMSMEFLPGTGGTEIYADRDRLKQVIINLLDNAIKYSPGGGLITVSSRRNERFWCLEVKDRGIGIPDEEIPLLFEKFHRSRDKDRRDMAVGTGLGMAIVKEIVSAHGGEIEVRSVQGAGTSFIITLPLK